MVPQVELWSVCIHESCADQCCSSGTGKSLQLPPGQTYMLQPPAATRQQPTSAGISSSVVQICTSILSSLHTCIRGIAIS